MRIPYQFYQDSINNNYIITLLTMLHACPSDLTMTYFNTTMYLNVYRVFTCGTRTIRDQVQFEVEVYHRILSNYIIEHLSNPTSGTST